MKKILSVIILCFCCVSVLAQLNLVRNPSFEDTTGCPAMNHEIFLTKYWSPAVDSAWNLDSILSSSASVMYEWTPDFEHICANGAIGGCPNNHFFYQYPRTGSAMVEVVWTVNGDTNCFAVNHYLQGRLFHNLSAGKNYCVTFYVNMENSSNWAINKIGAYLDDGSIDTGTGLPHPLLYPAQVVETSVISDTLNWVKVQGNFTANGTERFITIGVFADTAAITKVLCDLGCLAAYLIDDVSVISSDSSANAGPDVHTVHAGDTALLGVSNGEGMPCYWYILGGTSPIDSGGSTRVHPAATTSYVVVMDLCGHVTRDTVTVWVGPVGIISHQSLVVSCSVYPNPATGSVTVAAAFSCEMTINDITGRQVLRRKLAADKETVDISGLGNGLYFVAFADNETGESTVRQLIINN